MLRDAPSNSESLLDLYFLLGKRLWLRLAGVFLWCLDWIWSIRVKAMTKKTLDPISR